jgi:hypothetical protein
MRRTRPTSLDLLLMACGLAYTIGGYAIQHKPLCTSRNVPGGAVPMKPVPPQRGAPYRAAAVDAVRPCARHRRQPLFLSHTPFPKFCAKHPIACWACNNRPRVRRAHLCGRT